MNRKDWILAAGVTVAGVVAGAGAVTATTADDEPGSAFRMSSVTLDVYSHVAPAVEEEAARLVASKLLGAPLTGPQ